MDRPPGHVPATQPQGAASLSSIQNILVYNCPSSPPPTHQALPLELQHQQQQQLQYPLRQSEDPAASHVASAEVHHYATASDPDYAREEGVPPVADSSLRRRSINSSKRAAQNRAAQRAFRMRRERYVAGLEEKARNYDKLETAYMDIQRENYYLRTRVHKLQSEASILRSHIATSAPVSPSPPNAVSATYLPITVTQPIANTMSQYPGLRPVTLTEPDNYYHYYQYGHHHQHQKIHHHYQQQHHTQRQMQSEHLPQAHGYTGTINVTLALPSADPVNAQLASHAIQQLPPPSGAPTRLSAKHQSHSPDGIQHQQSLVTSRQSRFQRDRLPPGMQNPDLPMGHTTPTIGLHATTQLVSEIPDYSSEKIQSMAYIRDGASEMEIMSPAVESAMHKQPTKPASTNTVTPASTAPVLPSVREITQSIDAMNPSSPHMDCGASPRLNKSCADTTTNSNSYTTKCVNSKRRPW
ncbi:hypothetical protein COEREDRAFT_6983 [Coemansia reversa NRRL 1564]|uniref:BZIP domain-containing protein n=1 Tax=Coemansia reversa (strain ATCC 12441 / NRRL 1564) TaxID=763665 RepID=A0A2G5BFI4_COERN|nr:hypothetical protein COEREDRAFT_6983 [Coemansia reversa NRRL 1564]|eukprot:PIA17786.1 hypothetical protein COEREDRAFT_6983 [Coemansia reversa NRRL 1564]